MLSTLRTFSLFLVLSTCAPAVSLANQDGGATVSGYSEGAVTSAMPDAGAVSSVEPVVTFTQQDAKDVADTVANLQVAATEASNKNWLAAVFALLVAAIPAARFAQKRFGKKA